MDWLSVWKITHDDLYDYVRCPRILAFKHVGVKVKVQHHRSPTEVNPYTIGRIGEKAFIHALESHGVVNLSRDSVQIDGTKSAMDFEDRTSTATAESERETLDRISKKVMSSIDPETLSKAKDTINAVIKSSVEGALQLVKDLESRYGKPIVFSRANVRSTILQAQGYPDFIVGFEDNRYVIVEVKNAQKPSTTHIAQAGFYMEASKLVGATILMERITENRIELEPIATSNITDTIVVYPRLKEMRTALEFGLTTEDALNIMKVKHIAAKGLVPKEANYTYCNKCQFRNVCKSMPESKKKVELNSVKIAIPLPITIALKLNEKYGIDLDLLFHGFYLSHYIPRIITESFRQIGTDKSIFYMDRKPDILEAITGISRDKIADSLKERDRYRKILFDIMRKEDNSSEFLNDALEIVNDKGEARELVKKSLINVDFTCIYPSDSLKRVKESYEKFTKYFS